MAGYPPKKNAAHTFYTMLTSQADVRLFQTNPTLAAGDVKVVKGDGSATNITTLPTVSPAGSKRVKVVLSADEMNDDNVSVLFSDAAGAEWCDQHVPIRASVRQIDDLAYPTVSGRSLTVAADGGVHVDEMHSGVITNNSIADNAFTENKFSNDAILKFWHQVAADIVTAGTIGKRLVDNVDAPISSVHTAGTGAITWAYTLTNSITSAPIADADVWVTTDSGGTNVVASGTTNNFGIVTFYLDAGTYYVWRQKQGFNFTNPDTEVVA